MQVQPDDIAHCLDEERISRQIERLAAVRFQRELAPVASAIDRVLHCVAPRGSDSSARVTAHRRNGGRALQERSLPESFRSGLSG